MAEYFTSITDFVSSIIVYWWALIPGVLLGLGGLMTFCSEKVDKLFTSNKSRVRRYAIPISIIGLFIACFLAFHEERISHEDTKTKFTKYKDDHSEKGYKKLSTELESIKNNQGELYEEIEKQRAKIGSLDGIGEWESNTFIYRKPLLVLTKKVTWRDNLIPFVFTIDGEGSPYPESFIYWRIDVDRSKSKVKAVIDWAHGKGVEWKLDLNRHKDEFGDGIRLSKDRKMSLVTKLDKGTSPVILRVYITSFEVEKK